MTPRRRIERLFRGLCLAAITLPIALSLLLLACVVITGLGHIDLSGVAGSVALVGLTAMIALPIGIATAIWLQEYAPASHGLRRVLGRVIAANVGNLAGVPSVIYGLLGLGLFVHTLGFGRGWITAVLTLALLVSPIVVLASREALRAVPAGAREAGLALGATRWQMIRRIVLPMALPGIVTGAILAIARALGEAAPLLVLGALSFSVLPVRIFESVSRPDGVANAAGGIVGLLIGVAMLHGLAIALRDRARR